MDPNATWAELLRAYRAGEAEPCHEAASILNRWLFLMNGFPPAVVGVTDLDRVMALAVCKECLRRFPQKEGAVES